MFLINSIYTAELKPKSPIVEEKADEPKKEEETKKKEEEKEEEKEKETEKEEVKEEEKNEEKKEQEKKALVEIDTKNSINDSADNNSYILENLKDEEEEEKKEEENKKKEEENKKKEVERRKSNFIEKNKINNANKNIKFKNQEKITLLSLITKGFFMHIDKITLITMYLVSVYTVNLIHVSLVLILIFHIIAPGKLNGCYKMIILIFQLLYFIEFIIDLLKV